METGEAIGEFGLKITSTTLSESLHEGTRINVEGSMSMGGNVVGTLTLRHDEPVAYEGGKVDWVGISTGEDGEVVPTTGRGYYYRTAPEQCRLRLVTQVANGDCALVEGTLSPGHYSGVVFAWEGNTALAGKHRPIKSKKEPARAKMSH